MKDLLFIFDRMICRLKGHQVPPKYYFMDFKKMLNVLPDFEIDYHMYCPRCCEKVDYEYVMELIS